MTLTLTPDMEAQVRASAEAHSMSPEEAFSTLLNQALAKAEEGNRRTLAGLCAGVTGRAAERGVPLEDCAIQTQADEYTGS